MKTNLRFEGFLPSLLITEEAEIALNVISAKDPNIVSESALIEYDGVIYTCSLDVFLREGYFYASGKATNALDAIRGAKESIIKKIKKNKVSPFFSRYERFTKKTAESYSNQKRINP